MAEDPQRAKARATFGKVFMENAKPKPLAKNTATASQKVANSRPIPTYKNGGAVKKADGGKVQPERIAARMAAGNYGNGGKVQTSADTARKLATEMGGMKDGGSCGMKPVKKAVGGAGKIRKGQAPIRKKDGGVAEKAAGGMMERAQRGAQRGAQRVPRDMVARETFYNANPMQRMRDDLKAERLKEMQRARNASQRAAWAKKESGADVQAPLNLYRPGANVKTVSAVFGNEIGLGNNDPYLLHQMNDGSFAYNRGKLDPTLVNLTGDFSKMVYKKGGVAKKKDGGTIKLDLNQIKRDTAMRDAAAKKRAEAERYRRMMGTQEDILRRGERGQARDTEEYRSMKPERRAKGGAGKVRKGMMTGKGDIRQAVKPKKGIGGFM